MGRALELSGMRFGKWTILNRSGSRGGNIFWSCQCECGTIADVMGSNVKLGLSTSCGCVRRLNLLNKRFGKLSVLEKVPSPDSYSRWKVKCDCGAIKVVRGSNLVSGQAKSCGCSKILQLMKARGQKDPLPFGEAARRVFLRTCKYNAKRRKLTWTISDTEFYEFSNKPCNYCSQPPSQNILKSSGNFTYSGIDRLNSKQGYIFGNVVPCCWKCNWMKRSLSPEEFLAHVKQIHTFQLAKPEIGEMQHV